jgi:hypothetical protein
MIQDNGRLTMDNWQNSLVIKIESNGITRQSNDKTKKSTPKKYTKFSHKG